MKINEQTLEKLSRKGKELAKARDKCLENNMTKESRYYEKLCYVVDNKYFNARTNYTPIKSEPKYSCSFCGKFTDEVKKMIAGTNVFICNECIDLTYEMVHREDN